MYTITFLHYLIITLSVVSQANEINCGKDLSTSDLFQVVRIDVDNLKYFHVDVGKTEFEKLNDFLVERTDSTDPNVNFEIILEQLILDYKNKLPRDSRTIQVKQLFLSLGTLKKENECCYYGYKIVSSNFKAFGAKTGPGKNGTKMRRLDEILSHYIKRLIENCKRVYFKNFDQISKNGLDKVQIKRVDTLLDKAINSLTSDEQFKDHDTNYVERLYHVARKESDKCTLELSYIEAAIKESARKEPDEVLRQIGGKRTGFLMINDDTLFEKLFNRYVKKPCQYFREQFGPDVFEPVNFFSKFSHELQYNRVDFYESWLKYQLCSLGGSVKRTFERLKKMY